jgi:hypothetical protein
MAMPSEKDRSPKQPSRITITLKQMAAELADGHNLSKKQDEALLDDLTTLAIQHLQKRSKIPPDPARHPLCRKAATAAGPERSDRRDHPHQG